MDLPAYKVALLELKTKLESPDWLKWYYTPARGNRTIARPEDRVTRDASRDHIRWRTPPRYQPEFGAKSIKYEEPPSGRSGPLVSETDRLRRKGIASKNAEMVELADSFELHRHLYTAMLGKWGNAFESSLRKLNRTGRDRLYRVLIDEDRDKTSYRSTLNPREQVVYDEVRKIYADMAQDQIAAGQVLSSGKQRGVDPHGWFNVVDRDVMRVLLDQEGSPNYKRLHDEFIAHQTSHGVIVDEAEAAFRSFVDKLGGGTRSIEGTYSFGPVRMHEGVGLPDSWIEPDFLLATRRYVSRFARDRAMYEALERNPRLMAVLGSKTYQVNKPIPQNILNQAANNQMLGDTLVQHIFEEITGGARRKEEPLIPSLGRLTNALILSNPATRVVDALTTTFKLAGYAKPQDLLKFAWSLMPHKLPPAYRASMRSGLNRRAGTIVAHDIIGAHERMAEWAERGVEIITKASGSEHLEIGARTIAQAAGQFIAKVSRARALAGDAEARIFMKKLGTDWETASIEDLGGRVGSLAQGRYDYTAAPYWIRNSQAAPFMALSRWSMEQWHNFRKFAIEPAKRGNFEPAIMMLASGLMGGVALQPVRDAILGRKTQQTTFKEIRQAIEDGFTDEAEKMLAYKLAQLLQVTGTIGFVGDMMRDVLAAFSDQEGQGLNYPMVEMVSSSIKRLASAIRAAQDDPDRITEIWGQFLKDWLKDHVTLGRIWMNHYGRAFPQTTAGKNLRETEAKRDMRVFDMLHGKRTWSPGQIFPEYDSLPKREFYREDDPQKQSEMAGELVKQAVESVGPLDNDPTGLRFGNLERKVDALRSTDNPFAPSIEEDPQRFMQYLNWIERTQGKARADEIAREYFNRMVNQERGRDMLPSFSQ